MAKTTSKANNSKSVTTSKANNSKSVKSNKNMKRHPPEYRGRRFRIRLYPDNYYQQKFLDYLVSIRRDMVYILHDRTVGDKPHYHIIIHFDSPRTASSIVSAVGKAPYYEDENKKKHAYIPGLTSVSLLDKCEMCDILPPMSVLPCTVVEDAVLYLLHQTFACTMDNKEIYTADELHYSGGGREMFEKYTYGSDAVDEARVISDIVEMYGDFRTNSAVIRAAISQGRMDIVTYIRKHPTFVNCFLSYNYSSDPLKSGTDECEYEDERG